MFNLKSWLFVGFIFKLKTSVCGDHGILLVIKNTTEERFCLTYFKNIHPLPHAREDAPLQPLLDLTPWEACDNDSSILNKIHGKVVIVKKPNCTLIQKVKVVQDNGGTGIVVVSPSGYIKSPSGKEIEQNNVIITLSMISESSLKQLKTLGTDLTVAQYAPEGSHMDFSLLIIWFMAMLSIILGASWSRAVRPFITRLKYAPKVASRESDGAVGVTSQCRDEPMINVTPCLIVLAVMCMSIMLLLLYFFYDYLVYLIIGMFSIASTVGLFQFLEPFVLAIPLGTCRIPCCYEQFFRPRPEVRQVVLCFGCIALSATWFVLRKESYSWILQDILGIAFSINMLNVIRLPSFKICSILLGLLFFYDIFFVFITPLFTKSGESVMVEVATGGNSDEQMPMVLRVPHLSLDPLAFCFPEYSMLGFGDMLIPGLLVSYCYTFGAETGSPKLYFVSVVIAYGFGLIITFAGLYLMSQAQPALLYLVPCMLIPVTVISLCKKEFNNFWTGEWEVLVESDDSKISANQNGRAYVSWDASSTSDNASEATEEKSLVK